MGEEMAGALACPKCKTFFAISMQLERRRIKDRGTIYCPNGHELILSIWGRFNQGLAQSPIGGYQNQCARS